MKSFCMLPWLTVAAKIETHQGGVFHVVMRSPDGGEFPSTGCVLEAIPDKRFVWTSVLAPGFRPNIGSKSAVDVHKTVFIEIEPAILTVQLRSLRV